MPHTFPTETHLHTWNPSEDAFGRQELAKNVVKNILTKMDTPNVLGIYGDWGTGKTTFLHYLQMVITGKQKNEKEEEGEIENEELKTFRASFKGDLDKIAIVHFEPWKYEYAEGTDLLLKLIEKIEDSLPAKTKAWKKLKKTIKNISGEVSLEDLLKDSISFFIFLFSFFLPSGSQIFGNIQKVILSIGLLNSGGILNKLYLFVKKRDNFKKEDPFEQVGELFIKAIGETIGKGKNKEKIIIFIDDLDRCLPENTIKLLEALKNFLCHYGVIFVLAIDRRVVSEMIDKRYGLSRGYGSEYLEKIINFHIDLPKKSFKKNLEEMFRIHGFDLGETQENYLNLLEQFLFENVAEPRRSRRIVGQFLMQKYLLTSSQLDNWYKNDSNARYLFFATYLRYKWPQYFYSNSVYLRKIFVTCEKMRDHAHAKSGTSIDDVVASNIDIAPRDMQEISKLLFSQSLLGQQGQYAQNTLIHALEFLQGNL